MAKKKVAPKAKKGKVLKRNLIIKGKMYAAGTEVTAEMEKDCDYDLSKHVQ